MQNAAQTASGGTNASLINRWESDSQELPRKRQGPQLCSKVCGHLGCGAHLLVRIALPLNLLRCRTSATNARKISVHHGRHCGATLSVCRGAKAACKARCYLLFRAALPTSRRAAVRRRMSGEPDCRMRAPGACLHWWESAIRMRKDWIFLKRVGLRLSLCSPARSSG